jgi:predicted dehydrogenase
LIALAAQKGLTLMADHTFLYTGAVQKMKELIDTGAVGTPRYFDSARINLGLFQPDVNVLWDLAPHDISI